MLLENIESDAKQQPAYQSDVKIYHGSNADEPKFVQFRYREKPRDTFVVVHSIINDLTEDKFDIPVRNLLFTLMDDDTTYGTASMRVVPKGEYKVFANPNVNDLTIHFMDMFNRYMKTVISNITNDEKVVNDVVTRIRRSLKKLDYNFMEESFTPVVEQILSFVELNEGDNVNMVLTETIKAINAIAKEYVDGIESYTSLDNITHIPQNIEIMLYAPNGFFLID